MSTIRIAALQETFNRKPRYIEESTNKRSSIFGAKVFTKDSQRNYLPKVAFNAVQAAILDGSKIDRSVADQIATAMKSWAQDLGATHYTHWFQPLTGITAEKHDAFFEPIGDGEAIERFGGGQLVQQEPDASSFPNGGIRNTFEARGYTAWDHSSAKGQQLDDHYFGSIPTRALAYLRELEVECVQLGIPVKTRHNEVAPNQFEIAPLFEEANLAVDHNSLLMDVMDKVAERHNFKVLFHEKPFAGINGSGKHNNWSLATDTGVNLLAPGKTPMSNLQFLTFFVNTIMAVHNNADLLRAAIATASNDHRLGANEAPPAIISVFIGEQLTKVLDNLEKVSSGKLSPEEKTDLKLNVVGKIPYVLLDNTDRNRTSPFAFTGAKFEFRAVGSKQNCAGPMTVLNTIMADQLIKFKAEVDKLIQGKKMKKDDAIFNVLRDYIKKSKAIRFEGDGYGDAWVKEAKKRGLSNNKNTPDALKAKVAKANLELFERLGIMNEVEAEARYEIELEEYQMRIQIEGRVLGDIATNFVIPTAILYQNTLIENVSGLKNIFGTTYKKHAKEQIALIEEISSHIAEIKTKVDKMINERKKANKMTDSFKMAKAYCDKVKPYFDDIRYHCDKLEMTVSDDMWPLPKYRELLFTK